MSGVIINISCCYLIVISLYYLIMCKHALTMFLQLVVVLAPAAVICDYLAEECAAGRVIGLLQPDDVQVSPFGVIPKKTPGKWRLIVDLSAPEGHSVNEGVSSEFCLLDYVIINRKEMERKWSLAGKG